MTHFLGTHRNRLDAKGRVSIPAPFRALLRPDGTSTAPLILRASHTHPCIEGWPPAAFQTLARPLDELPTFSAAHDDLATAIYADAWPVEADKDGRIVLPDELVSHAGLGDTVEFLGKGSIFEIWEPEAGARRRAEARERSRGLTLRGSGP